MSSLPVDETFEHKGPLGQGGMSRVIKASKPGLPYDVALKLPLDDSISGCSDFFSLVKREYQLVGAGSFPGVVKLIEKPKGNAGYLVMELCRGATLDSISAPPNILSCLNLLCAVALSMEYVRTRGIIHGDLKPQNIFLPAGGLAATEQGLFYVKLADFAFGRFVHEPDEQRLGIGTVGYMPPETLISGTTSHASDLFALGVIAYELVTGTHPFGEEHDDPAETNSRVRENEPTPPCEIRPDCTAPFSDLIMCLLAKTPKERPSSAWKVCISLAECGASYPFRKALRPRHLLDYKANYKENVQSILKLDEKVALRLSSLCNDDMVTLRLILDANFRRNNLVYDAGKFHFVNTVYWPVSLRRKTLCEFAKSTFAEKKIFVRQSVIRTANPFFCDKIRSSTSPNLPPAFLELLVALLSIGTVKRISENTAPEIESNGDYETAARLYMRAGNLLSAERCAFVAVSKLREQHLFSRAMILLTTVIDYAGSLDKLFEVRQLIMASGDICKDQGDAERAIGHYNKIVELYDEKAGEKKHDSLLAETYKDLGDSYYLKQDYVRGIASLQESLKVFTELGDELEISHTHNNIGNIKWLISNFSGAIASYRLALRIQRRLMAHADIASTLGNIASINCMQGRLARSLRLFHLALDIQTTAGLAGDSARTRNNLGYVYQLRGESNQAIEQLSESLRINRRTGNKSEILHNLENLSAGMITAGQLRSLIPHLKEGIELSTELGDKAHLGQFHLFMAIAHKRTGRFQKARCALSIVEKLIRDIDTPLLKIACMTQIGSLAMTIGNKAIAKERLTEALALADQSGDTTSQLDVLLSLVQLDDRAIITKRTDDIIGGLHLKREKQLVQFYSMARRLEQDDVIPDHTLLPQVPELDDDIELPRMCNISAEVYIRTGQLEKAATLIERAKRVAGKMGLVPELVMSQYLLGKVSAKLGEYEKAFACFRDGLSSARMLNAEIETDEAQKLFQQTRLMKSLAYDIQLLKSKLVRK